VLAALGIETAAPLPFPAAPDRSAAAQALTGAARTVLGELAAGPVALDALLPGRPLAEVATVVQRLVAAGLVDLRGGMAALARP
jgi:hypothetical protein